MNEFHALARRPGRKFKTHARFARTLDEAMRLAEAAADGKMQEEQWKRRQRPPTKVVR